MWLLEIGMLMYSVLLDALHLSSAKPLLTFIFFYLVCPPHKAKIYPFFKAQLKCLLPCTLITLSVSNTQCY